MNEVIIFPRHPLRAIVIAREGVDSFLVRVRERSAFTSTSRNMSFPAARSAARDLERLTGLPIVCCERSGPEQMIGRWRRTGEVA